MFKNVWIDSGKSLNSNLTKTNVLWVVRDYIVEIRILNRSTATLTPDSLELH